MLIVSGTVGDTSTPEAVGNLYVGLMNARQSPIVQCLGFAVYQKDAVSQLKPGQTVSVKGKCMGCMGLAGRMVVLEDSVIQ